MDLNFNKRFASAHFHDFEEVSEIYRSNSGAVHKARFKFDKKWYVLKERNMAELGNFKSNRRAVMMHEVNMLQQLAHTNVIRCEGWFWDHSRRKDVSGRDEIGTLFIVLEYLDGGDLHKKIESHRLKNCYFSERYVWYIFHQICSAVCYLHENGIVHRDLKTLNIILTKNDTIVKVADLGVSRQVSEDTVMLKTFYGTPLYLSPELVDNAQYNEKTDIWSLGIILYELVALHPPFRAKTLIGLANAIRKGEYEPIDDMYSKSMRRCIQWLLQLDQKKRPSIRQVVFEVSKQLTPGYYGIEDWNKRPILESALSQALSQVKYDDQGGDDDDTDVEDDEEVIVSSRPKNLASPRIINAGGFVGNIARLIGEEKGAELENEKDIRLEKEWKEQKKENAIPNPDMATKEGTKSRTASTSRPSTAPMKELTESVKVKPLPTPMPIPIRPETEIPRDVENHRPKTAIDGHIQDTVRLRRTRERLRREREELREKERVERERDKKTKRDKQILFYEELKAQEKEKKERKESERAVEVKIAQEVKPLVEDKKGRGAENVEIRSARYNKDRERDYAKLAVNPPHPDVIGKAKRSEGGIDGNKADEYVDAAMLDKSGKSRDARKEHLHYDGSGKYYFAREYRKYISSPRDGNSEEAVHRVRKEMCTEDGVKIDTNEAPKRTYPTVNNVVGKEAAQDVDMMRVDTHRVYTILRREMLRLKRLEQLLQLAANGVNGNTGNKDLVEKISEANAIISEIKQATETGYLKKSLAYKLGLKVDGPNCGAGDKVMESKPSIVSQDIDNGRAPRVPQDHVVVGDGWMPPVEKNVIELEFSQKLPPKLSNDPFRHKVQLHSLFAYHNEKTPGPSPVRPTTASVTARRGPSGNKSNLEIPSDAKESSSRVRQDSSQGNTRRRPTTAAPVREQKAGNIPSQHHNMKSRGRNGGMGFNIISGAYF